jgi:hypothetical protein
VPVATPRPPSARAPRAAQPAPSSAPRSLELKAYVAKAFPQGPGAVRYTYVHLSFDPDLLNHADILRPDRQEGDNRTIAELPPDEGGLTT